MRSLLLIIALSFSGVHLMLGQLISIFPQDANTDSDVTITYNAALGNAALAGYGGDVYTYTGVITSESMGDWDWKYVRNNWGELNPNTLMTSLGNDLYEISFNIREFYEIPTDVAVVKLAFLFHNADYSLVGRTANGGDIFVEINKLTPGNYISHQLLGEKLEVTAEGGLFEFRFFNRRTVKVEYIPESANSLDTSFTVVAQPEACNPVLSEFDNALTFATSDIEVIISKSPIRVCYVMNSDTLLAEATGFVSTANGGNISFSVEESEHFYGGGSRAIPINRRGRKLRIYNEAHYGYGNNTPTLNISIPFVVSSKGYGLFFDNRFPADLDLDSENSGRIAYTTEGGRLRYFFIGGTDFDAINMNYTFLTGRQKLPPLWALGYIQSKYGYQNEAQARAIVNSIRQNNFPLDALILDLYWFGSTNDMGNLDWNFGQWPQPQQMISDFDDLGIKTILITEPYFTLNSVNYQYLANNGYLAHNQNGEPYVLWGFWAGNAALLDLTIPDAQDWMWNFYQARREEGVGGWWCDLGEPETHPFDMQHSLGEAKSVHNIYSLIWARFIDEKYAAHYPNERLFNLIRSGYAGMQRYSTFPWSGDIQRSFSGLSAQIPIMLGAGMSGLGYMHSDVGGFVGNENDGELFTRWVQFGVFAPILRLHGIGNTEPVNFPDPYRGIMRKYITLRYQMLPYNYTLAYENSTKGIPLARQLNFYEPRNESLADINDSYLWGRDFLIAPIFEYNATQRSVIFPEGKWLNYNNLIEYSGGNTYSVSCNINDIPLFVRAGCFIPTVNPIQSTAYYSTDSLIIKYYPDDVVQESDGYMYVDDGKSPQSISTGSFEKLHFNGAHLGNHIQINLTKTGNGFTNAPAIRNMLFKVFRIGNNPESVQINGSEIPAVGSLVGFQSANPAYFWNSTTQVLYINCSWDGNPLTISFSKEPINSVLTTDRQTEDFYLHNPWPNPFKDEIFITADIVKPGVFTFTLQNSYGITLKQFDKNFPIKGRETFAIGFLNEIPSGVYFFGMKGRSGFQVIKVVKY
jgi:alpha-glucosidase (family GH31 glycosyl hydrolase)